MSATTDKKLEDAFLAAAADKKAAEAALHQFRAAAEKLHASEADFKKRPRGDFNKLTVMQHLRGPDHFTALREFSTAKEGLLGINAAMGQAIIKAVEHSFDSIAKMAP